MEDETLRTPASVRCSAKANGTGKRCRRWAILGATVCPMHGGSAPQVRAKARERLQQLVHPALDRLSDLLGSDNETVALASVRFVLDRTVDEHGDRLGLPVPSAAQIEEWIAQLEAEANA